MHHYDLYMISNTFSLEFKAFSPRLLYVWGHERCSGALSSNFGGARLPRSTLLVLIGAGGMFWKSNSLQINFVLD